jgi:hypothetical protein
MSARQWDIAYDAHQQMTAVVESSPGQAPANPQKVWRYQYDASGNRISSQEANRTGRRPSMI